MQVTSLFRFLGVAEAHDEHTVENLGKRRFAHAGLSAIASVFIVYLLNTRFWSELIRITEPTSVYDHLFVVSVFVAVTSLCILFLTLFSAPYVFRPAICLFLIVSASASYFISEYGIAIDQNMIQNVLETDTAEAGDLINWPFIRYVFLAGVIPASLIAVFPLPNISFRSLFRTNAVTGVVFSTTILLAIFPFLQTYLSVFRENKILVHLLTPVNVVQSVAKLVIRSHRSTKVTGLRSIGLDARRGLIWSTGNKNPVLVIVLGETARADHFSINGYSRATTPRLSGSSNVVNFSNVSSCGTDTAVSVPCMFSDLGRRNFSPATAQTQENLLDVVQRAGVSVLWRDNQSGCKGVCARVPTEVLAKDKSLLHCSGGECFDEILIDNIKERIEKNRGGQLIVLHMMGSHGPAYYKRTPKTFQVFQPACQAFNFSKCTNDEIVNSYDNTINYADFVIAKLINALSELASATSDVAMMYVSDHGESLGENNMYLHGLPYALAPKSQTHVPLIMWFSPSFQEAHDLSLECLSRASSTSYSHDNLFHTALGMLDIRTSAYVRNLDLTADCRSAR